MQSLRARCSPGGVSSCVRCGPGGAPARAAAFPAAPAQVSSAQPKPGGHYPLPLSPLSFARLWRMRMAPGFIDGVQRRSVGWPWCRLKRSICSRYSRRLPNVLCAYREIAGDRLPDRLGALAPLVELGLEVALGAVFSRG